MIELPPFDALALTLHHSPGVQAILVGSGVSRAAGIPTGWEITLDLIRRLGTLKNVSENDNWEKWYRENFGKDPNYSEILDALASTPSERRAILHNYIAPKDGEEIKKPTVAHHSIARLVAEGSVRVVITTNFDRLLENALRDAGIEPTIIASDDAIHGATPLVHANCTVIKLHGDYLDTRIRNIDSELSSYSTQMDALLDEVFDKFGLIVVGWSGEWDAALRAAIVRAPSRRYPLFWTARSRVSELANDIVVQRGGRVIPIADADEFLSRLCTTVQALRAVNRPHPQSTAIAIATAKKYCRDDNFALEWVELLKSEADQIKEFVLGGSYPSTPPSNEMMHKLVTSFMAKTERLRRLSMVCGRWGTFEANKSIAKTIASLSFSSQSRSGYSYLIEMRKFAASICMYWNLVGLVDAENWKSISLLLNHSNDVDGRSVRFTSSLLFASYENFNWKFLIGYETRHTPISDYLFEALKSESHDIAVDMPEIERMFDKVEMLLSLQFAFDRTAEMTKSGSGYFWMPVGRFIWKNRNGTTLSDELQRLEALPNTDPIYASGLFGGSKEEAGQAFKNARDHISKIAGRFW